MIDTESFLQQDRFGARRNVGSYRDRQSKRRNLETNEDMFNIRRSYENIEDIHMNRSDINTSIQSDRNIELDIKEMDYR